MPYGGADKTVDVHLSWLRRKLGETAQEPRYLHTVRGVGVRLSEPAVRRRLTPAGRGHDAAGAGRVPGAAGAAGAAGGRGPGAGRRHRRGAGRSCRWSAPATGDLRLDRRAGRPASRSPVTVFLPDGTVLGAPAPRTPAVAAGRGRGRSADRGRGRRPGDRGRRCRAGGRHRGGPHVRAGSRADPRRRPRPGWCWPRSASRCCCSGWWSPTGWPAPWSARSPSCPRCRTGWPGPSWTPARIPPGRPRCARSPARSTTWPAGSRTCSREEREQVADLSHRLRTPLTALRLEAESLRDPAEAARVDGGRGRRRTGGHRGDPAGPAARRATGRRAAATRPRWSPTGWRSGRCWPRTPTGRCAPTCRPGRCRSRCRPTTWPRRWTPCWATCSRTPRTARRSP